MPCMVFQFTRVSLALHAVAKKEAKKKKRKLVPTATGDAR